jgi:hypothetical protein
VASHSLASQTDPSRTASRRAATLDERSHAGERFRQQISLIL